MKLFILFIFLTCNIIAQVNCTIVVQDSLSKETLAGVTVKLKDSLAGVITDINGKGVLKLFKSRKNILLVSYIGYKSKEIEIMTGQKDSVKNLLIYLIPSGINLQQVTVSTSRVNSFINDSPQRIETLGTEELQEKTIENPANISELLSELSAVQVVQTSALSGAANFRLLGLSGQYTQILKDGFPIFGGLTQDFGLIQIPPLDLGQIEIIKGASSTFYGNGAIAGIINLISKVPGKKPKADILFNAAAYGAIDAGGFYSSKKNTAAFTLLTMIDFKPPKDVNGDGFTEISRLRKFNIEPKLFLEFNETNTLKIGASYLHDESTGGDIEAVRTAPSQLHPYAVKHLSNRFISTADFHHYFENKSSFNVKEGISLFNLSIGSPGLFFKGRQLSSYSEINFSGNSASNNFNIGISLLIDDFHRDTQSSLYFGNLYQAQFGLFAVDNLKINKSLTGQMAVRYEKTNNYDSYILPNISLIYKPAESFFIRFGFGSGYRIPSPISFLNEMEMNEIGAVNVLSPDKVEFSNSYILDGNYNLTIDDNLFFKINQTIFSAEVKNPYLETIDELKDNILIQTQIYPLKSYGTETNLHFGSEDASLFVGLTYQKTERKYADNSTLPLTPVFKIVSILQIEGENLWEVDLGNIYMGNQYLSSGERIRPYTTFEALLEIKVGLFNIVLNCENIFNVMQSDRGPLVILPYQNPRFSEIWGPLEGRTINIALLYNYK